MAMLPYSPFGHDNLPKTPEEKKAAAERYWEWQDKQIYGVFGKTIGDGLKNVAKLITQDPYVISAMEGLLKLGDELDTLTEKITGIDVPDSDLKLNTTPQSGSSAKPIVYSDWSPVSKLFGMNQETAFSEHMANTAHQREVADLKAAGLNPVLGISGSGSSTVSGSSSTGSSSAQKADDNKFLDILGATSAVITAVATKNPMYGYMVSNIFKAFD